ncbi:MAG: hypothetical protein LUQ65_10735 [Candidatus Helarchaeota archaeon]|nr:hypothetical protein [Candidatus Helarchaeota archaeon]
MKKIILNLPSDWYYFHANQFIPVRNKKAFESGDLLYSTRTNAFYITTPRQKLRQISQQQLGKQIYRRTTEFQPHQVRRVSKEKSSFTFRMNKRWEITSYMKTYQPDRPNVAITTGYVSRPPLTEEARIAALNANERAKCLFYRIIHDDAHFHTNGHVLFIKSENGKTYEIELSSGGVRNFNGGYLCVSVHMGINTLPLYDVILAKALTIAYAPEKISTLK